MSKPCIYCVYGSAAETFARQTASRNDVIVAAYALRYSDFEPLTTVFVLSPDARGLANWLKRATAIIRADQRAVIERGAFRGHRQGQRLSWRAAP